MSAGSSIRFMGRRSTDEFSRSQRRVAELEHLLDAVDGVVWEADARTLRFTYVSRQAQRLLGFPVRLWTEEPTFWQDHLHPRDREWAVNHRRAGVERRRNHELEYRMIAADGRVVWLHDFVRIDPVDPPDPVLRGVMVDASARRDAEGRAVQHSRALLDLAKSEELARGDLAAFSRLALETSARTLDVERISVWLFNDERTLLHCKYLYEKSADRHSSGIDLEAARYPRYFAALSEGLFVAADDARTDPSTSEFAEGYLEPLGITSMLDAPMRRGGDVIGVVCHEHVGEPRRWLPDERDFAASVAHFVDHALEAQKRRDAEGAAREAQSRLLEQERRETQRVEEELERTRDRLVRQTRLSTIGQVVASIAHELRNPLAVIQNARFYLARRTAGEDPKWSQYLDIIEQEVHTADRIIVDLLEMTRAKEPRRQEVDIVGLARSAFERVEGAEGTRIEMRIPREPFLIHADPDQMRQVLGNLITNSAQAIDGPGRIVIEAEEREGHVLITFEDDGPGVAPDLLDRVFEALFTTRAKGTGLGLPICRQIIERHGGSIDVSSPEGSGARFTIRLPRGADAGESTESADG